MSSHGINRETGRPLSGWDHVAQSLRVLFSTGFGERVMRRNFGSVVPAVLGQPMTPQTLLKFYTAIVVAIELWEPRFRVRKISYPGPLNSPARLRQGQVGVQLDGDYRPNALSGDFTVAKSVTVIA